MTKAMRMALEQMRKSMPSKAMNKNDAARVESAIRNNPKMYKGLTPSQVLEMLPPKGRTGEVIGMPIKGKTTKKFIGGSLVKKGVEIGKDILGKFTKSGKGVKDKKGQTKTIKRRQSIQNLKTGKIKTNQGKGKKVGITQAQDKKTGKIKHTCEEKNIGKYKKKFSFLKLYFKYKAVAKEVSTYGINFLSNVNKTTGRIHSNYWQIVSTGRISSNNPNLQNIPAKIESDGSQPFRECFRGYKNNILLVADYSQQEPRVTADKCKDPALIEFYLTGDGDTHSMVSSKMFSVIEGKEVIIKKGDPRRQIGKVLNLKLDYGGSAYTVKDDLNTTETEAQVFINALIKAFPEKKKYFDNTFKKSLQQGYILIDDITKRKSFSEDFETLKKYTDVLERMNKNKEDKSGFNWSEFYKIKGKIQRNSQNYPIQGTSGSMTKLAAIYLKRELIKKQLYEKVWIVNLVHDEIVVETSEKYSKEVSALITLCMEKAGKVFCKTIPMIAETVKSKYWTH